MAINPMALMQLKERFTIFNQEHPKVMPFLAAVRENALKEGSIMEIKFTTPDGKEYVSNIKITANDVETIGTLTDLKG